MSSDHAGRRGSSLLDPRAAVVTSTSGRRTNLTQRRKLDATFRNDSLSSDQSEQCGHVRPPPPKPHKQKQRSKDKLGVALAGHIGRLEAGGGEFSGRRSGRRESGGVEGRRRGGGGGGSSSDEEIRSTPDYTSCGEEEIESESVSEKGKRQAQSD